MSVNFDPTAPAGDLDPRKLQATYASIIGDYTAGGSNNVQQYMDARRSLKNVCHLATAAALPNNSYDNSAGTLTATANGALTVDSVVGVVGYRVAVKNEAALAHNGLYDITQEGDGSHPYILTRSSDADNSVEFAKGVLVYVALGTVNGNNLFSVPDNSAFVLGTTTVTFTTISPLTAGQILALAGTFGTPGGANRFVTETDPRYVAGTAISVSTTGTQTCNTVGGTKITILTTEEFDTLGEWNGSRFTATFDGYYQITLSLACQVIPNAKVPQITLRKNGSVYRHFPSAQAKESASYYASSGDVTVGGVIVMHLLATDYLELWGSDFDRQIGGAMSPADDLSFAFTAGNTLAANNWMQITRIGVPL